MSKIKVSKEGKKFRDQYIIGKEYLPHIIAGLWLIRENRAASDISYEKVQELFEEEKYFFSANSRQFGETNMSVGKGNSMYVCLNRGMSIIPSRSIPTHAITKSFSDECCYVQYPMNNTPIFTTDINRNQNEVELPTGLDVMELPDESLFQTEMYINNTLTDGAATYMGLRDAGYNLGEVIYYGDSLLKIKRLDEVIMNVNKKLMEMAEISKHK